jgi:hypothetical protein
MAKRLCSAAITAMLIGSISAGSASASTEIGNDCTATLLTPGFTRVQIAGKPGGLPVAAPTAGVLTSWKVNAPAFAKEEVEYLKVVRPTGVENQFRVEAESVGGVIGPGLNVFPARIPVQAGDHLGAFGVPGVYGCATGDANDVGGTAENDVPIGTRRDFVPTPTFQVALSATIEPDADNDGFGDETQDKCPQSAQLQEACPPLTLSFHSIAGRSSATVLVTAGIPAQVTVSGRVRGVRPKRGGHARATVNLAPVTHLANPGQITKYKLKYPRSLRAALADLPPSRSLSLKVKATGANLAGVTKSEERTLKVKGQG